MKTDHATPESMQHTLDLFRLILHVVFQNDRATEVCISITTDCDGCSSVAIASDCDAFERYYQPVGRLKSVIAETCRTLAVVCRDRAVVHRGAVSSPIKPSEIQHDRMICSIGAELRCTDPGLRQALIELVEALMPPPNIHLEVQGRHLHARAPLRMMELSVGDDETGKSRLTGELHNLPPAMHEHHAPRPIILIGGIPVGLCELPYQFNVTAGCGLEDAETIVPEISRALASRMPSPLPDGH
jgi:hypothetical protein